MFPTSWTLGPSTHINFSPASTPICQTDLHSVRQTYLQTFRAWLIHVKCWFLNVPPAIDFNFERSFSSTITAACSMKLASFPAAFASCTKNINGRTRAQEKGCQWAPHPPPPIEDLQRYRYPAELVNRALSLRSLQSKTCNTVRCS